MTTARQKQRMVKDIEGWGSVFNALLTTFKPVIVAIGTFLYNAILVWMLIKEKLDVSDFIAAVGPMNMAIVGFLFSRRRGEEPPHPDIEEDK